MDDFGTGFSSLDRLRRLPIDVLKIDRSFVASMMRSEGDRAIVNAVVTLAHAVGATVTAEGVEGADQMDELRVMGCDLAQGYALARPLSPEQFAATVCNGGLSATEARAPSL
jgi:EAL domain-containing protein (putative c-di-GMP-specific phosphodiesterase class I)